jgi:5-methylcytosine-specific restriction endonuclease McrA
MANISDKNIRGIIFSKYKGKCAYCGCSLNLSNFTVDHIEPKFRNYTDKELERYNRKRGKCKIENYNPCCKSCNSSKSTFTIEKWREEINKKYDRLLRDSSSFRLLNRFNLIKKQNEVIFYFEKHQANG